MERLHNHRIISIIGIAKNAGKTTVLNTIIEQYKTKSLCITSIGLDGEKYDNITNQEKPRVQLYPGMYVLTAEQCLNDSTIEYLIHERTPYRTALGQVLIVEVIKEGRVLVAGPSSKQQMKLALKDMEKYKPYKILIDGALYRKSIASAEVSDGIIFVTGASYSSDINETVKDTKIIIDQLQKKVGKVPDILYEKINENILSYNENTEQINEWTGRLLNEEERIVQILDTKPTHLYLPGALTDRLANEIIRYKGIMNELDVIVQDSSYLLLSSDQYEYLTKKQVNICVLNPIEILFVAYNPVSPFSYDYDDSEFRSLLSRKLGIQVVNILQDLR